MVIISVLGVLSILMILNMQLSRDTVYNTQYLTALKANESAYYLGLSAARGCIDLLSMASVYDKDKIAGTDSLKDMWARPIPLITIGNTTMSVEVVDLERYFNLNSVTETKQAEVFKRLLRLKNINENYASSVIDWVDTDDITTEPDGSEFPVLSSLRSVKNAPMDSVDELFLIDHFQNSSHNPDANKVRAILPFVCACGGKKININTAGKEVLMALDDEIDEKLADTIIEARNEKAFENIDELTQRTTADHRLANRLQEVADVKSEYFLIKIEINKGEEKSIMSLIVKKEQNQDKAKISVINWKVQ